MTTRKVQAAAAFALALLAGMALADDDCRVPVADWQPREAVLAFAQEQGWTLSRLRIDHGCYELRVTDPGSTRLKLVIDPATLNVIQARVEYWGGRARAIPASRPESRAARVNRPAPRRG